MSLYSCDIIPVDIAINCLLIVAREAAMKTAPLTNVYNVSSHSHWPFTHTQVADYKMKAFSRSPPATALRPFSHRTTEISQFEQRVVSYCSELLFAIVTDTVAKIRGKNSEILKLTRFIQSVRDEQASFFQSSWVFPRKNIHEAVTQQKM